MTLICVCLFFRLTGMKVTSSWRWNFPSVSSARRQRTKSSLDIYRDQHTSTRPGTGPSMRWRPAVYSVLEQEWLIFVLCSNAVCLVTNALMVALRGTWPSFVVRASIDVQEWDQPTAGSSTYRVRRLHVVTGRSPSLVHALGTTYLMPSETRLCHS